MIDLDGSGGGGQLVRTALALSALTGRAFRMTGVRGGRSPPGLRPQHLSALRTVASICDADIDGGTEGATEIEFHPGDPRPGTYTADIGTAGSVTLLFDTLLPLAVGLDGPIRVTARGGTDVRWSPSMAFHRAVKLPLLRRYGLVAATDLTRTGFYPTGGGEATLTLGPSPITPIRIRGRGDLVGARVYSRCSADLASRDVAARQATAAADRLAGEGISPVEGHVSRVPSPSTGSVICVRLDFRDTMAGFDALGERGTPAEEVGETAADAAVGFLHSAGVVDRHLADQLVPFVGLRGGRIAVPTLTDHIRSTVALLARFDVPVDVDHADDAAIIGVPDPPN